MAAPCRSGRSTSPCQVGEAGRLLALDVSRAVALPSLCVVAVIVGSSGLCSTLSRLAYGYPVMRTNNRKRADLRTNFIHRQTTSEKRSTCWSPTGDAGYRTSNEQVRPRSRTGPRLGVSPSTVRRDLADLETRDCAGATVARTSPRPTRYPEPARAGPQPTMPAAHRRRPPTVGGRDDGHDPRWDDHRGHVAFWPVELTVVTNGLDLAQTLAAPGHHGGRAGRGCCIANS